MKGWINGVNGTSSGEDCDADTCQGIESDFTAILEDSAHDPSSTMSNMTPGEAREKDELLPVQHSYLEWMGHSETLDQAIMDFMDETNALDDVVEDSDGEVQVYRRQTQSGRSLPSVCVHS
jgi:hypothetical protein